MDDLANIKKRISLNQSTLAKGYPGGEGYGGYGKTGVFGSWFRWEGGRPLLLLRLGE